MIVGQTVYSFMMTAQGLCYIHATTHIIFVTETESTLLRSTLNVNAVCCADTLLKTTNE